MPNPAFTPHASGQPGGGLSQTGGPRNISFCNLTASQVKDQMDTNPTIMMSMEVLFIPAGCFLNGLGCSLSLVFGLSYLDLNTSKRIFPVFLGACLAARYT